jgi:predicted methyltransferase
MKQQGLSGAVALAHLFLSERLKPGDTVVDATCGNGQDTLLLAGLVGNSGQVWAFDVQKEALARTRERLHAAGMEQQVRLIHAGHERLAEFVAQPVQAVVFNLGYLPAGDRAVKTAALTTVAAATQAATLLQAGGVLLLVVYTGHDGGLEEWQALQGWAVALHPQEFNVWHSCQLNRSDKAPFLVTVEKMPLEAASTACSE